jgi:hypothetical protein
VIGTPVLENQQERYMVKSLTRSRAIITAMTVVVPYVMLPALEKGGALVAWPVTASDQQE